MRVRMAARIVVGVAIILFVTLAFIFALVTEDADDIHHGFRAVCAAVLALTAATCYRYFED